MKKLFTLIAVALTAMSASADEVVLMENVTDGTILNIADIEAAGGADADIVTFYISMAEGVEKNNWGLGGFGKSSSWDTTEGISAGAEGNSWTYEYTVARIKEVADGDPGVRIRVWSDFTIEKITLSPSIGYSEGRTLAAEGGFIAASEFDGLSDNAKVEFTYNIEGDISGYMNWGIGRIGSNDDAGEGPSVVIASISVKAVGEQTVSCKFSAIKPALEASPDGILVSFWSFGDGVCTGSFLKAQAFEVAATGISDVKAVPTQNTIRYNLTGQRVDASYKGVVIENGRKILVK